MRKIIVSMNVTSDGFMAGPDCELNWHFNFWNQEMTISLTEQLAQSDTILLGRITYCAMAAYWPFRISDPLFFKEDITFADMMNSYRKIVFSKTLSTTQWNNSELVKGNISIVVPALKEQPGKNIIVYGSGKIVAALAEIDIVDEYQLWIHPVILDKGKLLFEDLQHTPVMKLLKTKKFRSGVILNHYEPI
jgi:dihydrofolate reductase